MAALNKSDLKSKNVNNTTAKKPRQLYDYFDPTKALYPQVVKLSNEEYENVLSAPLKAPKSYWDVKIFDNPILDLMTRTSLQFCYMVWVPCCYFVYKSMEPSDYHQSDSLNCHNIFVIGLSFFAGIYTWGWLAYDIHWRTHDSDCNMHQFPRWFQFVGHGYHHLYPFDHTRIVIHPWIASLYLGPSMVMSYICNWLAELATQYGFFPGPDGNNYVKMFLAIPIAGWCCGMIIGHLYVESSHYGMHKWKWVAKIPGLGTMKCDHMMHHCVEPNQNFAYLTVYEDEIMGTRGKRQNASNEGKGS